MFEVDKTTGLVCGIDNFELSPNHNERPAEIEISLLVIHNISLPPGQFGNNYIRDFFMNELQVNQHSYFKEIMHLKVSAHLVIQRNGTVLQFAPLHKRAWHAGVSSFQGREDCNDYSIGIELEGTDDVPYTEAQYAKLVQLTRALRQVYPAIVNQNIVGHCDIAPERKTDPGAAFDWNCYFRKLNELSYILK